MALKLTDPSYPVFPIFSFLSFLVVLIPLPWHLQAWNSGTCLYMIWTAVGCLNMFINSIIWHKNVVDWAPAWCDISSRIMVGVAVALPATSLCINRRLHKIATCQSVSVSPSQKRRDLCIDLLIGVGIPALQMVLQFIVQGHRYDIFEDIGCYPTTVNTPAAYPLSLVWSNVISLVSAVYGILTVRAFIVRRAQFNQFLSHNPSLTMSRYFRLMALATVDIFITVPLCTFNLYYNIAARPMYPWTSWSDIHADFFIISTYRTFMWRSDIKTEVAVEMSRWSLVFCGFIFFVFFGFAEEAQRNYRRVFDAISRILGLKKFRPFSSLRSKSKTPLPSSLPVYQIKAFPPSSESSPSSTRKDLSTLYSVEQSIDDSSTIVPSPPAYQFTLKNNDPFDARKLDDFSLRSPSSDRSSRFTI